MKSCLYTGHVSHTRHRPKRHAFRYRVFSMLLDLDEMHALDRTSWLFGVNRPAPLSFREADHGDGTATGLRDWVVMRLQVAGYETQGVQIRVLCYPRIFGYVFNPLTTYYCYDNGGALMATLHEVHNTFDEKHTYILPATANEGGTVRQMSNKNMYVSPFTEMGGTYRFVLNDPADEVRMGIHLSQNDEPVLSATFCGTRREMSARALLHTFFQYPLMTLKVIGGIYFEALRLWIKGVAIIKREAAPIRISSSTPSKQDASSERDRPPVLREGEFR